MILLCRTFVWNKTLKARNTTKLRELQNTGAKYWDFSLTRFRKGSKAFKKKCNRHYSIQKLYCRKILWNEQCKFKKDSTHFIAVAAILKLLRCLHAYRSHSPPFNTVKLLTKTENNQRKMSHFDFLSVNSYFFVLMILMPSLSLFLRFITTFVKNDFTPIRYLIGRIFFWFRNEQRGQGLT